MTNLTLHSPIAYSMWALQSSSPPQTSSAPTRLPLSANQRQGGQSQISESMIADMRRQVAFQRQKVADETR